MTTECCLNYLLTRLIINIFWTEIVSPTTVREFERAAYAPLRELLPKYTEFQSQILLQHLNDPVLKQVGTIIFRLSGMN